MDIIYLNQFKNKANVREVDTTNGNGYGGYKGKVYKLGNMELFDTFMYFRFERPKPNIKYLHGTTRITKQEFLSRVTKLVK